MCVNTHTHTQCSGVLFIHDKENTDFTEKDTQCLVFMCGILKKLSSLKQRELWLPERKGLGEKLGKVYILVVEDE